MFWKLGNSRVPPPSEWIKINFDVPSAATFWAVGVVARNSDGELLWVFTDLLPKDKDSLPRDSIVVGEAIAAKAAIECAKRMEGKDFIILEGDSREVIRAINSAMNDDHYNPDMVDERIFDIVRLVARSLDKCIGGHAHLVLPEENDWASRVARWAGKTKNSGFVTPCWLGEMAKTLKSYTLT